MRMDVQTDIHSLSVPSGLEADQKVLAAHMCYAMTATTALTAQNTLGVSDIHVVPAGFVRKAIECCVEDVGVDVVKTGWSRLLLSIPCCRRPFL